MLSARRISLHVSLMALAVWGCTGSITEDRYAVHRVVGRVLDPAGQPVVGAMVSVRSLWGPACNQTMSVSGPVATGSDGRYRGGFGNAASEFNGCVEARVAPPPGSRYAEVARRIVDVRLNANRGDSVVVDVQFADRP